MDDESLGYVVRSTNDRASRPADRDEWHTRMRELSVFGYNARPVSPEFWEIAIGLLEAVGKDRLEIAGLRNAASGHRVFELAWQLWNKHANGLRRDLELLHRWDFRELTFALVVACDAVGVSGEKVQDFYFRNNRRSRARELWLLTEAEDDFAAAVHVLERAKSQYLLRSREATAAAGPAENMSPGETLLLGIINATPDRLSQADILDEVYAGQKSKMCEATLKANLKSLAYVRRLVGVEKDPKDGRKKLYFRLNGHAEKSV